MHVPPIAGGALAPTSLPESSAAAHNGPQLVHLKDGYIPQGQGYDAGRGQILTSYYKPEANQDKNPDNDGVLLSIQDKNSRGREELKHVRLVGGSAENLCAISPDKGGGVATDGKYVYLADTESVYVYRREDIDRAADGAAVEPVWVNRMPEGQNASYVAVKDGRAYVGQFSTPQNDSFPDQGYLTRFDIDSKGAFVNPSDKVEIPDFTQGVAVTDRGLLFTTSYGTQQDSDLLFQAYGTDPKRFDLASPEQARKVGDIDDYAEGLNIIDGEVWVTYESAADEYKSRPGPEHEHIQRIPLDRLQGF